jgi:hypothetical protein
MDYPSNKQTIQTIASELGLMATVQQGSSVNVSNQMVIAKVLKMHKAIQKCRAICIDARYNESAYEKLLEDLMPVLEAVDPEVDSESDSGDSSEGGDKKRKRASEHELSADKESEK